MKFNEISGDLGALGLRFGIVASRFNDFIVDRLLAAAVETLAQAGADADDLDVVRVPGAFEIPLALKLMAAGDRYDGLLALGCVIRGETPHFNYVAGEASRGVTDVSLEYRIPVGFGILTVDTIEQAKVRSGSESNNTGAEAASAVSEMANLRRRLAD
ncbi:MAG: 6,7-dimethyl-8-ribityllumazine synthase [Proteobacteria bacterium]|nr:6,7-dimethyl-8-ribityllumazine synthase [Pseudomonadota bacterium]